MTVSETNPTPEQIAASERAMDGLEAQADIWAEKVRLIGQVKLIGHVARGLNDRMPADVRNGFIARLEALVDAFLRQAYLEGFYRGGESRKEYDEAQAALTAALSDQVVVPREPTPEMIEAGASANPTVWNDGTDDGFACDVANEVYRAMITAAPPPSSTAGEGK